ncbi:lantibiotic dehydratase [Streptomyces hainanensis]|uniref:Lantibiotic dehydratase n=2 Tax=Streptomyces hainanensis TaxID=402648 RepID=A0A4R4TNP1_9ACTN|nr:lantibiotic dehydratase [Streptomyces hainanensis]TDC75699.1 lantibiotic dehydratase [Streptomyces hainanensis]
MLRATTDPGALDLPRDLDLASDTLVERGRAWLAEVWRREEVRDAIAAASPALCDRIDDIIARRRADRRQVRKAVLSMASYLLRWQGRPTPFALFGGITPASAGAKTSVTWGGEHRTVLRPDADWLADIINRLHRCAELVERLPIVAVDAGQVRGDRYAVPGWPSDGRSELAAPVELSVRHTRPVAAALELARTPIRYGKLRTALTERYPQASTRIDTLLGELVAQHLLISSLWPPATCLDLLGHLCTELDVARAHTVPDVADLVAEIHALHTDLPAPSRCAPPPIRGALPRRMTALSDVAPVPLVIDTILDCEIRVPEHVVREAAAAAGVLIRLSPHPAGSPRWRDYHDRFLNRYGAEAIVHVLELTADSGLGLPAGYLGAAQRPAGPHELTRRDERLLALVQQSMLDRTGEIVLTEPIITDLARDANAASAPPGRVEVSAEIHAPSVHALDRGAFRLVITGAPRPASSMAGRFAHLLPEHERAQLAATYRTSDPEAIAAQLSFAPRRRRNENIIRTTQLLPHVIPLAEHRPPRQNLIPLADLAVTADEDGFSLIQLSTGRRVEPRVTHALEAGMQTPPLARFLAEITTARCAVYQGFDFTAANHLPYLPRVRYHRTVLASARWLLTPTDLPGPGATQPVWDDVFEAWRTRFHVPEHVALVEHEQRLPLDLTHPLHRSLLRARLDGARRLELREAPAPGDLAWLGRAHELLVPLTLAEPQPHHRTTPTAGTARAAATSTGRTTVVTAHVHAHPDRHDDILTRYLPDLINTFDTPPLWWFTRHHATHRPDAEAHLVLSVHLPEAAAWAPTVERLHRWASTLRSERLAAGLTLATHEPPPGRYGHGEAMDAAHHLFAADSAAALAQIEITTATDIRPQALAAASMLDLATHFARTLDDGLTWLTRDLPQHHGPLDQALRDQAFDLTDHLGARARLGTLSGGEEVAAAWQRRAGALATLRKHLADQRDPLTVLQHLLHLHHQRVLGPDAHRERDTLRLVRACALRHTAWRPR